MLAKPIRWLWRPDIYAIALGAIIVIGSLLPPHSDDPLPEHFYLRGDLYQHVGAYALLTFFALLSWGETLRRAGLIMISIVCLGAVLEFIQPWVGRSLDAVDLAANSAGVIVGGICMLCLSVWRLRTRR
jgi:VanZ family protein